MQFVAKTFDELTTTELYELLKARAEIFITEQHIEYVDEDDVDYRSLHCFFWDERTVTAYLRAYYVNDDAVRIGRVLTLRHGEGMGRKLMGESMKVIPERLPCKTICMDAQKHAIGFYEKCGFFVTSDVFPEAGIEHVRMEYKGGSYDR